MAILIQALVDNRIQSVPVLDDQGKVLVCLEKTLLLFFFLSTMPTTDKKW